MRRLSLRRFPQEVIRRRMSAGGRNEYGEYQPGRIVTAILPARLQPLSLQDQAFVGGELLSERVQVYVPIGIRRIVGTGDTLTWHGQALSWNGAPLTWGAISGYVAGDADPLVAAFDDRGADEVEIAGKIFAVEETALWAGSHCRAVLLRES